MNTLECLINVVPVRMFIFTKIPPYTGLTGPIWHYTFINFFSSLNVCVCILARQFLRKSTNSPYLVVDKSFAGTYTMYHWEGCWKVIHWNAACRYKQEALVQIVLQATLHIQFVRFATLYSYLALYYY